MSDQAYLYNPQADRMAFAGNGIQLPRLTTAQRLALTVTASDAGMEVFDLTVGEPYYWNGSTWVASGAADGTSDLLLMSQAMGSGFKALMHPLGTFAALTLAVNRLYAMSVWLPKAATITGVAFPMRVLGDYTASDYNGVGLYRLDPSTGICSLLASTPGDDDFYKASTCSINYWNRKPFSTPYAAEAGLYYVAFLHNRSAVVTGPALQGITLSGTAQQGLVNMGALPLSGPGFACGIFWSLVTHLTLPVTTISVQGNNNSMLLTPVALY